MHNLPPQPFRGEYSARARRLRMFGGIDAGANGEWRKRHSLLVINTPITPYAVTAGSRAPLQVPPVLHGV